MAFQALMVTMRLTSAATWSGLNSAATSWYAWSTGGRDVLELTGNPLVITQYGQMTGDAVAVDRANATLKATGNWKLKLKVKAWEEAATIMPQPPAPIRNAPPGR